MYVARYESPLGELTLASDGEGLVGLWMEGQRHFADALDGEVLREDLALRALVEARAWLDDYFSGGRPTTSCLVLAPRGGPFRQAVWSRLLEIPYGQVITYGEIAKELAVRLGRPAMSSRAVGGAVGHNPLGIIVPCHRVVGARGALTGYAGGVERKAMLLAHEGVDLSRLRVGR